jgi:hypothetical protein
MANPLVDQFDDDAQPPPPDPGPADASSVELVLFPGEFLDDETNTWRGRIYARVDGRLVGDYDACAGPAPGSERADQGGHVAGATTDGNYTLAQQEHHTTPNWPRSVVPWGAQLRVRDDQEIEYSSDGNTWRKATGADGGVTLAQIHFEELTRADQAKASGLPPAPLTDEEKTQINLGCRQIFYDINGALLGAYNKNDFGNWAWCLLLDGDRSEFFVHTTPNNEAAAAAGRDFQLTQSHGCIHIRPADRDQMMGKGLLQRGVRFTVEKYGIKGP